MGDIARMDDNKAATSVTLVVWDDASAQAVEVVAACESEDTAMQVADDLGPTYRTMTLDMIEAGDTYRVERVWLAKARQDSSGKIVITKPRETNPQVLPSSHTARSLVDTPRIHDNADSAFDRSRYIVVAYASTATAALDAARDHLHSLLADRSIDERTTRRRRTEAT